jgi:hypothetical protein
LGNFVHMLLQCYNNTFWVVERIFRGRAMNVVSNGTSSLWEYGAKYLFLLRCFLCILKSVLRGALCFFNEIGLLLIKKEYGAK